MTWLLLAMMVIITFSNRYIFLSPRLKFTVGPKLQTLLQYTAPSVLTALWAPIVFMHDQSLNLSMSNPCFLAGLMTIATSYFIKKPLIVVIAGTGIYLFLSHFF